MAIQKLSSNQLEWASADFLACSCNSNDTGPKNRTQKQEIDNMYYVCLSYVKVLGTPVRDFDITVDDTLEDCMNEGNVSEPTLVFGPSGL